MEGYRRTRLNGFEPPRKKPSGVLRFFIFFAIPALGAAFFLRSHVASYENVPVQPGTFSITKGETAAALPKKLKLETGWRSKLYFRYFAPEIKLQVGTYKIPKDSEHSLKDVYEKVLPNPDTNDVTITFLPGWTVYDIDAYLSEMGIIEKGEVSSPSKELLAKLQADFVFLKERSNLEGFLYPDTYRIRPGSSVSATLSRALSNFESKVYSKHKDLGESFYETLIMASIVEKEERIVANKAKVAGVLWSRLEGECADTGKIIGADATVCYPYGITSKECTPSFIVNHLYDQTEYNTRKMAGLPPTPIANPTIDSFLASRNPEKGRACYYLHDPKGNIHFANDIAGHERNKNLHLR